MKLNLSFGLRLAATFILLVLLRQASGAEEGGVLLKPPGLRLSQDLSITIPAHFQYANKAVTLPHYRKPFGEPVEGWEVEVVKTRRFFSHRSARVYYRNADLTRSRTFTLPGSSMGVRVWPLGTIIVLENYVGDGAMTVQTKPEEVTVMAKMEGTGGPADPLFSPAEWSYGKFTAQGSPSLPPEEVEECHQCHSIAFHLTGDLIFTPLP